MSTIYSKDNDIKMNNSQSVSQAYAIIDIYDQALIALFDFNKPASSISKKVYLKSYYNNQASYAGDNYEREVKLMIKLCGNIVEINANVVDFLDGQKIIIGNGDINRSEIHIDHNMRAIRVARNFFLHDIYYTEDQIPNSLNLIGHFKILKFFK